MLRRAVVVVALAVVGLASGCAFGKRVQYAGIGPDVGTGNGEAAVAVHDQRRPVVSGEKSPWWVGLSRSSYGIPFNVSTQSGQPLAEDLLDSVSSALRRAGIRPVTVRTRDREDRASVLQSLKAAGPERAILLTIYDWKTDYYLSTSLQFDLDLEVLDREGGRTARAQQSGRDEFSGDMRNAAARMSILLCQLLTDDEVAAELGLEETADCPVSFENAKGYQKPPRRPP